MKTFRVAAAGIAVLLLAGCTAGSNGGSNTTAPFDPSTLVSTTPAGTNPVDKVTWGIQAGEPSSLDPVRIGSDSQYQIIGNMCEALLQVQPDFSTAPGLATDASYDTSGNVVINLRPGVTFWDGTPMTADDVAYSLQRSADPTSGSITVAAFERVANIAATGPLQVTVSFTTPDSQFLNAIAGPAGFVFEKAFSTAAGAGLGTPTGGVMCTGPFSFTSWTSGKDILLTANPDYWGGAPLVKQLDFVFTDSDATLTNALVSGEIDGAFDVPVAAMSQLRSSSTGSVYVGPSNATSSFGPASATGPGADPNVREALNLAIDKNSYVSTVLGGYGTVAKTFTTPFMWEGLADAGVYKAGYDALPTDGYDLAKAKQLVADAHLSTTDLTMAIPAGAQQILQSATIVQAAAKQLGLNITIKQLQATDFGNLFYDPSAREGIDFVATTGYLDTPGAYAYASLFALPGGLFNWTNYSDDQVTALLQDGRTTQDQTKAAQDFVAAQAIYAPAQLQVTLANQYTRVFLSSKLTGVTTSFSYIVSPWALKLGGK
ncbi:ABC transporter substrate-binding protein [Subtercola sp. YIM 133946]|uniref:ABC transporter substrate-binding protein n=1 Tax=Subtercola sp. YIM 133946 TaxID=3118909 RepID=UPI002F920CDE